MSDEPNVTQPVIGQIAKTEDGLLHLNRTQPDVHLALPLKISVQQQLEYYSGLSESIKQPLYIRMWICAQVLIQEWDCALMPDRTIDLNSLDDPDVAMIVMWAGNAVSTHMVNQLALPKVSSPTS